MTLYSFGAASAQDGVMVLRKASAHSTCSLSGLPEIAIEVVVMFVWLNIDYFCPLRLERQSVLT